MCVQACKSLLSDAQFLCEQVSLLTSEKRANIGLVVNSAVPWLGVYCVLVCQLF